MPSTYSCLTYHLVFSTKHRQRFITNAIQERLYRYLGGVVRSEGGVLLEVGGVADHVHLLVQLKPTHTVSDLLRVIKTNSSKWINDERLIESRFAWQEGYSAFTVSQSQVEAVRRYLQQQEEHHRESTFRDELQGLCERHGVAFDAAHFEES